MEEITTAPETQASDTQTQETDVQEIQPVEQTESVQDVAIPDNWEAPIKEFFNNEIFAKDPAGKKAFFEKFKSFDEGYSTKFQDLANQRKEFEATREAFSKDERFLNSYRDFEKVIAPEHHSTIMAQFGGIPQYMANLYNLDRQYSEDPLGFITGIMQKSGITLDMLQKGAQSPEYQQRMAQSQQQLQLSELEKKLKAEMEGRLSAAEFEKQVNAFCNEKDEKGNLKRPYVDKVADTMDLFLAKNPEMPLQEAYDRACYADPEIRGLVLSAQSKSETDAKAKAEELAKAKAAKGITTAPKHAKSTSGKSWQDVLEEQLAKQPEE